MSQLPCSSVALLCICRCPHRLRHSSQICRNAHAGPGIRRFWNWTHRLRHSTQINPSYQNLPSLCSESNCSFWRARICCVCAVILCVGCLLESLQPVQWIWTHPFQNAGNERRFVTSDTRFARAGFALLESMQPVQGSCSGALRILHFMHGFCSASEMANVWARVLTYVKNCLMSQLPCSFSFWWLQECLRWWLRMQIRFINTYEDTDAEK